jgi:hypothetical protein
MSEGAAAGGGGQVLVSPASGLAVAGLGSAPEADAGTFDDDGACWDSVAALTAIVGDGEPGLIPFASV